MIIAASRISTASGAAGVKSHVFEGPKNESIEIVRGARADLDDMVHDAREHGAKYAVRHYKISPEQATTREQALGIVAALGDEFGFDPERAVVVEHEKPRAGGKGFDRHWHAMVPEVDPERGRVLDSHWMRARHEKVSRVAELELGHDQVRGKWNKAVERALRADDRHDLADRVKALTEGDRPREAFTAQRHQAAERRGLSMPEAKAAVAEAWQRADGGRGFAAALAGKGLTLRQGERNGTWIVEGKDADGDPVLIGAVHRLTGSKKNEAAAKLADLGAAPAAPEHRTDAVPAPQATASAETSATTKPLPTETTTPANVDTAPPAAPLAEAATSPSPIIDTPAAAPPAEVTSPAPPIGGGRAGGGSPHAPTGGGSGAAVDTGGGGADFVRPMDPRNPEDFFRWMRDMAAFSARQAATLKRVEEAAKSAGRGGQHSERPDTRWIEDLIEQWRTRVGAGRQFAYGSPEREEFQRGQRAIREIIGSLERIRAADQASGLERDGHRGPDLGHDAGRRDPGQDPERGLPGHDTGDVRGPQGGEGGRGPDVAPGRGDADRVDPAHAGGGAHAEHGGCDRAHRGQAARARAANRRAARGLGRRLAAPGLIEEIRRNLAPPEEREHRRIIEAVRESDRRAAQILDGEPWRDPATRDVRRLADAADDVTDERVRAADHAAEAARAKAEAARAKLGFFDRLAARMGIETDAAREAREAEEVAEAVQNERPSKSDIEGEHNRNRKRARSTVRGREAEREAWGKQPDVVLARREQHGNQLLKDALQNGDREARAIAAKNPAEAREALLRREEAERQEEIQRERERLAKLAQKNASPGGPRMR